MSMAHITLFLIGLACLFESLWAVTRPERYRETVARIVRETELDERYIGVGFAVTTLVVWLIAATGQAWAHRALFGMGLLLMLVTFIAFRPGGLKRLLEALLLKQSSMVIRAIYLLEFAAAAGLIGLALSGR